MSVDDLAEYLNEQLTHELATDAWVAQLKDSNFEDEQVREELEPIIHDTNDFATIFNDVGKLADKITITDGGNTWKTLVDAKVDVDRVTGLFWVFIDKALAKNSNTRDIQCGFASTCCWLKLAGLKGSTLFHFFNQYLYKMILSSIRLIYRLKMYGSRNATTIKKKPAKGKKGMKKSAPMREEPEEEEEDSLNISTREIDEMLEKACDALYSLLKTTPLSTCPEQAKDTVDLVRDLIRLDICKDTDTTPVHSLRELNSRDLISDRAFCLAHLLCESRHSNGGVVVHTRLVMPRLVFFSWEGEVIPGSQSIPMVMVTARDKAIAFIKDRILAMGDEENDELDNIAKLVPNMMTRCPERAEYRQKVAQSALQLLALLPKKISQAQLQLVYTFGLTAKTGLRAFAIEMIPSILQTMDLQQDAADEDRNKSRWEKKGSDEEEEEDEMNVTKRKVKKEKKNKRDDSDEEDDEMNGTRRKVKKEKKKKRRESDEEEEEEEMDRTRRKKKKKGSDEEEEEEMDRTRRKKKKMGSDEEEEKEDGNTTKRRAQKDKKKKADESGEEEDEDEGNTTKRRQRAAKDQSMIRMQKQKKRDKESGEEEEEESEGEKEKKKKKKQTEKAKLKNAARSAPVQLRPSLLTLMVRGCLDKAGNLRARSLQQLSAMISEDMAEELKEAADNMVRDCPNIVVQAMTNMDEQKEGEEEEEEDEEKKARAAKLAELAAAELQIKNGLVYVVKSRMDDDVAAVRKAAVATIQSLFFVWDMEEDDAEEMAHALKLRCLDTSQTVRRQAMETLTLLLDQSLELGHRSLLETTWLRAVLPLINDRENAVQTMAAKLVEETLIEPIMRSSTPLSCWNMLKRVEEEVSNRRLLVRTLAFLSTKESKTLKATVVDTLNKKLATDPDHSNVIWMLLADLSTVFGDKIDPRTAVRTWYDLPESETANTLSYVAKVVGEGAKKLKDEELDKVSQDMEDKLLGYRVHGPHIPTVYLALARLMDAVGELASGTAELERFGRKLLEEASRIIYNELEMFTELDEDKQQEVSKEDEVRVIRIVITIGEVIQLSPSLIDFADRLLNGLKMIMASELYLSDFWQQRKVMNSAVPSRVSSAMGGHVDPLSQGSGQQSDGGSQPNVIPSQVHQEMKNQTLRKALFTPAVRRCALTTIGKFCLMDENTAKKCVFTFIKQLQYNPDHIIRNNIVIVLCDLCVRYTLLVDKYTPIVASCLKDRATLVRHQTLECLTILIKEQFIRWEGQLMYRFVATILDENRTIRDYARFCLNDVLLPQDPSMFFNHFIECLLYFNDVPRKYMMHAEMDHLIDKAAKFTLSGPDNETARIKLYEFMLATFDDRQKLLTMSKMCEEIFSSVYTGEWKLEDAKVEALLTDAFKVISCEQMQFKLELGKKGDGDEDDEPAPQAVQEAAKSAISDALRGIVITTIMPHVLELRRYILEKRHPILKHMLAVLRALTRSHMDKLQDYFAGDKIQLRELEYDIKRLNNLEEKLKLRAAEEAKKAAERALLPPSRRQSMRQVGGNGMDIDEGEGQANPDDAEIMEEVEVVQRGERRRTMARADKIVANEDAVSVDVEMEMEEAATVPVEKENHESEVEKENEKEGEEGEAIEDGGEMEVDDAQGGDNGDKVGDGGEKENENEDAVMEVVDGDAEMEGEEGEERNKKTPAEVAEVEIKEEPIEEEERLENEKEERRRRRKEEMEKRREKEMAEVVIKEEPLDEPVEKENQFVVPAMIEGGKKRSRAASELAWMNESAMVGGYGQSTPRKGTPVGDEEADDMGGAPRLDLDISAIAPPPAALARAKSRVSRKPKGAPIEE